MIFRRGYAGGAARLGYARGAALGLAALAAVSGGVATVGTPAALGGQPAARATYHASSHPAHAGARVSVAPLVTRSLHTRRVPSEQDCQRRYFASCYSPRQFAAAYDVTPLWQQGITGAGRTIVVVDSFGSPTIRGDLKHFDHAFGLPKAHLVIDRPSGPVSRYDPRQTDRTDWATETTLDVEYAHALAPDATIRLLETPIDETEGVKGLPQMMHAEAWAIRHGGADVISQSFGATEQTFPSAHAIRRLRGAFTLAARHDVTVLAAAGDNGATDLTRSMNSTFRHRVQSWPSADPLVTSVGGLRLRLDGTGQREAADRVWHDLYGAGGGGRSRVFGRPWWQNPVKGVVGARRGVPDVSMSADVNGGALVWTSFRGQPRGWQLVGGTSLATPLFAGIVALADQAAGRDLGLINPALYRLGAAPAASGLVDVTRGNNSFDGVKGYDATRGFDLASGWGTVDAARFVPALVAADQH